MGKRRGSWIGGLDGEVRKEERFVWRESRKGWVSLRRVSEQREAGSSHLQSLVQGFADSTEEIDRSRSVWERKISLGEMEPRREVRDWVVELSVEPPGRKRKQQRVSFKSRKKEEGITYIQDLLSSQVESLAPSFFGGFQDPLSGRKVESSMPEKKARVGFVADVFGRERNSQAVQTEGLKVLKLYGEPKKEGSGSSF